MRTPPRIPELAMNRNVETLQSVYAAFGRGDIPAILATMSPDIVFEPDTIDHGIPWIMPGRGIDHVTRFFGAVAGLQFDVFAPEAFLADDQNHVAVLIRHDARVSATGKRFAGVEIHYWTFDDAGQIVALKHFVDTKQHYEASH
ncbi:MAG: nuclear transport factor 2 family protein [Myxococcales bacterium]|nr:nuclear transport factor 2 family protein [Myxococcales bacterium]